MNVDPTDYFIPTIYWQSRNSVSIYALIVMRAFKLDGQPEVRGIDTQRHTKHEKCNALVDFVDVMSFVIDFT